VPANERVRPVDVRFFDSYAVMQIPYPLAQLFQQAH
jgi:hypothetical protein